jgi:superfamily II RNA helicase
MEYRGYALDRFQEEAIRAIERGDSVIAAAPTGSGKTLIAEYAIEKCLASPGRIIYTAPIKALSNQKYREFTARWGERVGIVTGDVSLNAQAPIVIMTTEIFRNGLLENDARSREAAAIIFDEVHFLDDPERGTVWEESIIFANPGIQIICLSATISNLDEIGDWIRKVRPERPLAVVEEKKRPVPLIEGVYLDGYGLKTIGEAQKIINTHDHPRPPSDLDEILRALKISHRLPALYFLFSRRDCENHAAYAAKAMNLLSDYERGEALKYFDELADRFRLAEDRAAEDLRFAVSRGFAFHHAGILPTLKEITERLFEAGFIKALFATETFALGVNMPARTVMFESLMRKIRGKWEPVSTREYFQMAGRAGRRGKDDVGYVYARTDPYRREFARTLDIIHGTVEPILSRISPSYSTLLKLYPELGDDIYSYLEKSLYRFQMERKAAKSGSGRPQAEWQGAPKKLIAARLDVLEDMGYLRGRNLTNKGKIASRINGFEIQVTEVFFNDFFRERLNPEALCVLFASIICEQRSRRRQDQSDKRRRGPKIIPNWWKAEAAVENFQHAERRCGIREQIKGLDASNWRTVHDFARGASFEDLGAAFKIEPGDLVRQMRMAIQMMKQAASAFSWHSSFVRKLETAWEKLNRDEVDAEFQLRICAELPSPGHAAEEPETVDEVISPPDAPAVEEPPTESGPRENPRNNADGDGDSETDSAECDDFEDFDDID